MRLYKCILRSYCLLEDLIPAKLCFFCHWNNSSIKFEPLTHRINILNRIDELFRFQEKRQLAGMGPYCNYLTITLYSS